MSQHSTNHPASHDDTLCTDDAPYGLNPLRAQLAEFLTRSDMHAVLASLNARTRYRFTGLYRVESALLRNLFLFDRENPRLSAGGDIAALRDTYCSYVVSRSHPFATSDALGDARLRSHPANTTVLSYLGVPIRGDSGRVLGTLCHFDVRPRLAPIGELAVLELVATMLPLALLVIPAEQCASSVSV